MCARRPTVSLLVHSIVLFSFLLLLSGFCPAQSFTATITGRVKDDAGEVLPGAKITLTNAGTNRAFSAQSNEDGYYTVPNLTPGIYRLIAEHNGFKKFIQNGITLEVDDRPRIDVTLSIGSVSESVQITGEPPLLNTETGSRGDVITNKEINDLPLNGRDFTELAFLTAGVVPVAQGGQGGFGSINGARADSINLVVDGLNNQNIRGGAAQVRPSVEAIQEFKVQTSAYSADYGRLSTGLVNIAIKSGTNQLHGSLFEFVRNDIFDTRNFFADEKLKLRRNQFGGSLGGPVSLPKEIFGPLGYRGRDRTFFFVSFEGNRERRGRVRLARVPTLAERQGDFSAYSAAITDPFNQNQAFPDKRIPANRFSPVAVKVLDFYPLPNASGVNNYSATRSDDDDQNHFLVKFDQKLFQADTLSISYITTRQRNTEPFAASIIPGFAHLTDIRQEQTGIRYTHIFRPALTNEFRFSLGRTQNDQHSDKTGTDYASQLGIVGVTTDPALTGFPRFTVSGYEALGEGAGQPVDFTVNNFQFADTISLIANKHFMRFGFDIIRTQFFEIYPNNARGTFNFLGRWTGQPFADLMLGLLENTVRQLGANRNYLFSTTYGFFIQDDIKLTNRLTLNLGLRYDLLKPPKEKYNRLTNFIPEVGRVVIAGDPDFPEALVNLDKTNFAPRFGFAYRVGKGSRMVVRGGYGIFYSYTLQNPIRTQLANNYPFTTFQRFNRRAADPSLLTLSTPFPTQIATLEGVNTPNGVEYAAPTAYLQQYNLTIERELMRSITLEVGYVGSLGSHLGRSYNLNQPIRDDNTPPFPVPYAGFGTIDYLSFGSRSNYHALQTTIRKRFQRGLSFRANFAWSKSIDDASQISGVSAGGFDGAQDARGLNSERGLSDFDRRRVFTFDMTYALPFGRGKRFFNQEGMANALLGNWQFNTLMRLMDGQPFTPQLSNFNYSLGESKRPDRIGSGKLDNPGPDKWFKVEDFVPVPRGAYRFGTAGRNILIAPGRRLIDMSLFKNVSFSNEKRLQFRFEVFNVINTANFLLPNRNIDVPQAATINSALNGREIQLGLKFLF